MTPKSATIAAGIAAVLVGLGLATWLGGRAPIGLDAQACTATEVGRVRTGGDAGLIDVRILCARSEVDGVLVTSPHEETVSVPADKSLVIDAAKLAGVTRYPTEAAEPKTLPGDGCACSSGGPTCEVLNETSGKWSRAPKTGRAIRAGTWRGACVPSRCGGHLSMWTGVGATNAEAYFIPPSCGGPGKVAPVGGAVTVEAEP